MRYPFALFAPWPGGGAAGHKPLVILASPTCHLIPSVGLREAGGNLCCQRLCLINKQRPYRNSGR